MTITERPTFGRRGLTPNINKVTTGRPGASRRPIEDALEVAEASPPLIVPSQLLDFTSQAHFESEMLELYFGPNAEKYLDTADKLRARNGTISGWVPTWCWPAFWVPIPWMLYRKQWIAAAATLILPILAAYFFPLKGSTSFAIGVLIAMFAKSYYVTTAAAQIRAIMAMESEPAEVRDRVRRAGGVSVAGAVVGGVIMGMLFLVLIGVIAAGVVASRAHGVH